MRRVRVLFDLVPCDEPGEGLLSSIAVMESTVLAVLPFLGSGRDSTVAFIRHDDCLCGNAQRFLRLFAPNVRESINELGLSWVLAWSSFELVLGDTLVSYGWEIGEVLHLPESHRTLSCDRPLDGDVPVACRALPANADGFAVARLLLSTHEALARFFGSHGARCSAFGAMSSVSRKDELTFYSDDIDSDDWEFADVPADSHVDVRASLR